MSRVKRGVTAHRRHKRVLNQVEGFFGGRKNRYRQALHVLWKKWVYALDRKKAYELSHRELAQLIKDKYHTPDWWTQTVAVGYERIKGLRVRGQRRDGFYSASKSRTL